MATQSDANSEVLAWLEKARTQSLLKGGKRRYDLLAYLVNEELQGRGENVKAYAIALDVLGRGADFDPTTDSIVRVEVARLRDALELHYARSQDPSEPKITIPKGSYRPKIELATHTEQAVTSSKSYGKKRLGYLAALVAVIGLVFLAVLFAIDDLDPDVQQVDRPIIEVAPISLPQGSAGENFALGFRQQLLADLSHLPTVIVRDGPLNPDDLRSAAVVAPSYRLAISPTFEGQSGIIGLQLTSQKTETVVYARTITIADSTSDFYKSLTEATIGIGQEVAGPSGAITIEQAALAGASEAEGEVDVTTSEYQCLIVSLVFDATKNPQTEEASRTCLARAIADGTQNSTLLSAQALNLFFESSRERGLEQNSILHKAKSYALEAIRIRPSDAFAHEVLGNILSAQGDRPGAIEKYRRAVELAPSRPAPHFLLGWQMALGGDWKNGVVAMQEGIDMQPNVPGYMIIPLALDAFRQSDYALSLSRAQTIIDRGDTRGYSLAFAASVALGDMEMADRFFTHPNARTSREPSDPMREVRVTFSDPDVMPRYQEVIESYLNTK
ncbi:tetratricopeptide repeat protein [Tateyamaria sp. SN3-11]|uniref:tetratricopeptide repeat protein n=1 Tax=Tateyamaria sp. SN3-11 TaxID=3092147 RepID=UPI0039E772B6